jgi:hypothetical protein
VTELQKGSDRNVTQIELLAGRVRGLRTAAEAADGRELPQAEEQLRAAAAAIQASHRRKGVTEQAAELAGAALAAAESGEDVAVAQVQALRAYGITGVPLVDVVGFPPTGRCERRGCCPTGTPSSSPTRRRRCTRWPRCPARWSSTTSTVSWPRWKRAPTAAP